MTNRTARPTDAQQLVRAHQERAALRREVENLRNLVARVETFRERMNSYGGPVVQEWADVLGSILSVRDAVHPES
jgi:hypothetical protein